MYHLTYIFLIGINILCMFIPIGHYNWFSPMVVGFVGGLWFSTMRG